MGEREREDCRAGVEWGLRKEVSHRFSIAPTAPCALLLLNKLQSVDTFPLSKQILSGVRDS